MKKICGTEGPGMKRVLILEDESFIRSLCCRLLVRNGPYVVESAGDISEAKELLKKFGDYALLITDLRLPDGNGSDFIKAFLQECPAAKVMVLTGSYEMLATVSVDDIKKVEFLVKPFDQKDFLDMVDRLQAGGSDAPGPQPRRDTKKAL
jgi:DNA-binding NtrC family response regulator